MMKKDLKSPNNARAYLMGVYLSDGILGTDTGAFRLTVTDETFRDEAARALDIVGSEYTLRTYPPHIGREGYNRKRTFRLRERSPYKVSQWLEKEFPEGKDHLPNMPDDLVRDLVAGVLDGDGSIFYRGDGYQLKVCGYSDYLADLEELLDEFEVIMHYRPGKKNHYINLRSFAEADFYFRMPRKQKLVEEYTKRFMKGEK